MSDNVRKEFEIVELLTVAKQHKIQTRWLPLLNIKEQDLLNYHYISEGEYTKRLKSLKKKMNQTSTLDEQVPATQSYNEIMQQTHPLIPPLRSLNSHITNKEHRPRVSSEGPKTTISIDQELNIGRVEWHSEPQIIESSPLLQTTILETDKILSMGEVLDDIQDDTIFQHLTTDNDIIHIDNHVISRGSFTLDNFESDEVESLISDASPLIQSCEEDDEEENDYNSCSDFERVSNVDSGSQIELLSELFRDVHVHGETLSSFIDSDLFSDENIQLPQRKKTKHNPNIQQEQQCYYSEDRQFKVIDKPSSAPHEPLTLTSDQRAPVIVYSESDEVLVSDM
ncbi:hypothetical protein WICPIJ_004865 [Wickerhamomyces pijperi]|uniref:Uncharacterized protein n=1 Tax=Wickerhamomyces pijperi TaxID=599730 RepID=A0A9P8Q6R4_WICPI|nr:hypothetical protein WICPIJ_004865 [Wickerhamomyces pijperi]